MDPHQLGEMPSVAKRLDHPIDEGPQVSSGRENVRAANALHFLPLQQRVLADFRGDLRNSKSLAC
jgi:hypothetical protein